MASNSHSPTQHRMAWGLLLALVVLAAPLAWFISGAVHYLTDWSVASYTAYYWGRRFGLIAHVVPGVAASSAGLVQLWLGLTGRSGRVHRVLGRVYVAAVALGSLAAVYLALTITGHFAYASGLVGLALAWATTTAMAVATIRTGLVAAHRQWMVRSYTVTFAFVLLRLVDQPLHWLIPVAADPVADQIGTMTAWASWAVPLLLVDLVFQARAVIAENRGSPG